VLASKKEIEEFLSGKKFIHTDLRGPPVISHLLSDHPIVKPSIWNFQSFDSFKYELSSSNHETLEEKPPVNKRNSENRDKARNKQIFVYMHRD
jgi:hypothetical protein